MQNTGANASETDEIKKGNFVQEKRTSFGRFRCQFGDVYTDRLYCSSPNAILDIVVVENTTLIFAIEEENAIDDTFKLGIAFFY